MLERSGCNYKLFVSSNHQNEILSKITRLKVALGAELSKEQSKGEFFLMSSQGSLQGPLIPHQLFHRNTQQEYFGYCSSPSSAGIKVQQAKFSEVPEHGVVTKGI